MVKDMTLVIVESPTKARTLSRFLGDGYEVEATYGHMRDLPQKKLGVDIKNNFEPLYVLVPKQKERVKQLQQIAGKAQNVYLATDPDREGEAIAWHTAYLLGVKNIRRIVFHEVTERAINQAIESPRDVDMKLVDAQQARRILDRLVGYKLSPLLWQKVRKGLSAGRVQSVAVKLVVEREREIEAFVPEEYWVIQVELQNQKSEKFWAGLVEKNGKKLTVGNQTEAGQVEAELRAASYQVSEVETKEIKRTPPAPFNTSVMQQTAANRLGWSARKTMQVAQMLYEEGYITYHRTDSTNLAAEAVKAVGEYITNKYGKEYALAKPRFYKTKSKVAQEAHEAIRPTRPEVVGEDLADLVNRDQVRLYDLVWRRFVACQMADARGVHMTVKVSGEKDQNVYGLETKAEKIEFEGWMKVYQVANHKSRLTNNHTGVEYGEIPVLAKGDNLEFSDYKSEQKFTQPPARYNDASLIKALEERGIGRPSTYAPILSTIQDRQYVEKIEKRLKPTALGTAVNDFLVKNFPKVVDYGFTAQMEDELDEIANGQREWKPVISEFFNPFKTDITRVSQEAGRVKIEVETTGEKCPECGQGDVVIRIGRFGKFLACSRYPECKYKANYHEKIGIPCPKCGGDIILRRTKSRKTFYGCSNYPACDFASWTKPTLKAAKGDTVANDEKQDKVNLKED